MLTQNLETTKKTTTNAIFFVSIACNNDNYNDEKRGKQI